MKVVDLYDTDKLKKFNVCKKLSNFYGGEADVTRSYFFLFENIRKFLLKKIDHKNPIQVYCKGIYIAVADEIDVCRICFLGDSGMGISESIEMWGVNISLHKLKEFLDIVLKENFPKEGMVVNFEKDLKTMAYFCEFNVIQYY